MTESGTNRAALSPGGCAVGDQRPEAAEAADAPNDGRRPSGCEHVDDAVDLKRLRRRLKPKFFNQCQRCRLTVSKDPTANVPETVDVAVCLSCGHQGCFQSNLDDHSSAHYMAVKTGGAHPVCLLLNNATVWCHECSAQVPATQSDLIDEAVAYIRSLQLKSTGGPNEPVKPKVQLVPAIKPPAPKAKRSSKSSSKAAEVDQGRLPIGLYNLGSTCFFNAVVQVLLHTPQLRSALKNRTGLLHMNPASKSQFIKEAKSENIEALENIVVEVTGERKLLNGFVQLAEQVSAAETAIRPEPFYSMVLERLGRFTADCQHDSHEFLRCLADVMREEELAVVRSSLSSHFKRNGRAEVTEDTGEFYAYLFSSPVPIVDGIFMGTVVQCIRCRQCGHSSFRLEPFLDLSLSLCREAGMGVSSAAVSRKTLRQQKKAARKCREMQATVCGSSEAVEEEVREPTPSSSQATIDQWDSDDPAEGISFLKPLQLHTDGAGSATREKCLSIEQCLVAYFAADTMDGSCKYDCESCRREEGKGSVYSDALKRIIILSPPAILTLHLKRFCQEGFRTRKLYDRVSFPTLLDMSGFCSAKSPYVSSERVAYALYAVICHDGSTNSGHYVCYVKIPHGDVGENFVQSMSIAETNNFCPAALQSLAQAASQRSPEPVAPDDGQWYYMSDKVVRVTKESEVLSSQAYLLFYRRIS